MHPRMRWRVGRPPLSKSRRLSSVSIVIVIIIVLNITVHPAYSCHLCFPLLLFHYLQGDSIRMSCRFRDQRSCAKEMLSSSSQSFSCFLRSSLHLPVINFLHARPRPKTTHTRIPSLSHYLTRAPVCRFSPYAFVPYAARCASSASLCRHSGDTETGAPCRTPISDDSSGCSLAYKPCRRPDNWSLLDWTKRSRGPCRGPRICPTWSTVRDSIPPRLLPT